MAPLAIVKDFDVVKDIHTRLLLGEIMASMDPLHFKRREEALGRRIIPAVASTTHALLDAIDG